MLMPESQQCLVNGVFTASLPVNDRGYAFGEGAFETMRVDSGGIRLLRYHEERLRRACKQYEIPFNWPSILADLRKLLGANAGMSSASAVVKVTVSRASSGPGNYLAPPYSSNRSLQIRLLPELPKPGSARTLCISAIPLMPVQPDLAGFKLLTRTDYSMAAQRFLRKPLHELLFLDTCSYIADCIHHNIFWVESGRLFTPALGACGVHGVMRRAVIEVAGVLGIPVIQGDFLPATLASASEIFITNAVDYLVPVSSVVGSDAPPQKIVFDARQSPLFEKSIALKLQSRFKQMFLPHEC